MNVLLVEDDSELARVIVGEMRVAGHACTSVSDGAKVKKVCEMTPFDVIILDVNLPTVSGFELIQQLRAGGSTVPVIFLTALDGVNHRVNGLKLGADDYLTKPFAMEELLARIDVVMRRQSKAPVAVRRLQSWLVDGRQRKLVNGGDEVLLQPRECALLELLMDHPGRVLTKSFLLDCVWGIRFDPGTNVVDSMVCRLRRSLQQAGFENLVQTIRGQGYVFHPPA